MNKFTDIFHYYSIYNVAINGGIKGIKGTEELNNNPSVPFSDCWAFSAFPRILFEYRWNALAIAPLDAYINGARGFVEVWFLIARSIFVGSGDPIGSTREREIVPRWTRKRAGLPRLHNALELGTLGIHVVGLRPFAVTCSSYDVKFIVAITCNVDTFAELILTLRSTIAGSKTKCWKEQQEDRVRCFHLEPLDSLI